MSDLFQDAVPDEYIIAVAAVMLRANWHTYQVLTKRADRLEHLLKTTLRDSAAAPHIWWGVSVEDKKYGIPRIKHLRDAPATVRFLSIEPLLEDLGPLNLHNIDWVIVGGESGPGARPMHSTWVHTIKHDCAQQGCKFFFKQWGGVQKAKNGRLLDGRTHDDMPALATAAIPSKAHRDALANELDRRAAVWTATPLVHLTRQTSVA
jgi:protein gp37